MKHRFYLRLLPLFVFACAPLAAATPTEIAEQIVRDDVRALNENDPAALVALFDEESRVFGVPTHPDHLVGPLSTNIGTQEQRRAFFPKAAAQGRPDPTEIVDLVSAGDLVIAKLRMTSLTTPGEVSHSLVIYRVRGRVIADMWHVARSKGIDAPREAAAKVVIDRFVAANNRGDVSAFLGAHSPDFKFFRNSGAPHMIGDKPPKSGNSEAARRSFFTAMFAKGAPAQVEVADTLVFDDLVVSRDVARLSDGKVLDEISIYRIAGGKIVRDWLIYEEAR